MGAKIKGEYLEADFKPLISEQMNELDCVGFARSLRFSINLVTGSIELSSGILFELMVSAPKFQPRLGFVLA